jgi:hypothetical protein
MEFYDLRTGEKHRIFTLDRITLRFPDGSTAQVEMVGLAAASGHFFRFDPDSIRLANGAPIVQLQPPMPATPAGGGLNLTPPWLDAAFAGALPYGVCAFLISHCEFTSGGSVYDCYYRREPYPCA